MEKNPERLRVIENIKKNIKDGNLNGKVEEGDPVVTEEQRENVILPFDLLKEKPINKIKRAKARFIVNNYMRKTDKDIEIIGLENAMNIKGGAIITSNHFHYFDTTIVKKMSDKTGRKNKFRVVAEEENVFLPGLFGFLFNYYDMLPLSQSKKYMAEKFMPAIKKLLKKNYFILVYPEEQMWFQYRKPRPLKPGAYHFAVKNDVPILPCFTEILEVNNEYDENGFKKLKYRLHVMEPIYANKKLNLKDQKEDLAKRDYELKVKAYEEAYGKKLDYKFKDEDIAGYVD